ncbi:hypothetical protein [Streptococcus plurextorum]|uniref:hypothetical protein n=1 Tax=Streptococcus plurextorum TaxID=456876 RepID=UPI000422E3B1|nr:hypothetical protein [Streptococcus plurextorum]
MKHYFNKYNLINFSIITLLATTFVERLTSFLIVQMNLSTILAIVFFIFVLRLGMILSATLFFFTVIIEFGNRNAEFDYFSNSIKSYIATWKIRRYCTQINVEPTFEESMRYLNTKQLIIKKANHSILTLVVVYYEKHAIALWKLPSNSESYRIMEELLPQLKRELNQLDDSYLFSDFIRLANGRVFKSTAIRKK